MKRTGFKRKLPYRPDSNEVVIKAYPKQLKKRKKKEASDNIKKLKERLWELCRLILRATQPNICYTCGKKGLAGSDWHTGHGKAKGALQILFQYDLRNLKSQCMHCNKNLGGCSDIFISKLEKEKEGLEFLTQACNKVDGVWYIKHLTPMSGTEAREFVKQKIVEYEQILAKLSTEK